MKLRLPKALMTAMAAAVVAAAPLATTVATGALMTGGVAVFAGGLVMAETVTVNLGGDENPNAISSKPTREDGTTIAAGDTLNVNIAADSTVDWLSGAQIDVTNITANVTVGEGATLNLRSGSEQFGIFNKGRADSGGGNGSQTVVLEAGSTLNTYNPLAGWRNDAYAGLSKLTVKEDATWNIYSSTEYMNQSTVELQGGTMLISAGSKLQSERPNGTTCYNFIKAGEGATKMSVIQGGGEIYVNNCPLTFNVVHNPAWTYSEEKGSADLLVSTAINSGDATNNRVLIKTGNGVMEVTSATSNFAGAININEGTLRLSGADGRIGTGTITVANGATLELRHTAETELTNNIIIQSGAVLDIFGATELISGDLTVNTGGSVIVGAGDILAVTHSAGLSHNSGTITFGEGASLMIGSGTYAAGTYTVGTLVGISDADNLSGFLIGLGSRQSASYNATTKQITVTGTIGNLVWNTGDTWNASTQSWQGGGSFESGDNVTFNNGATVTLSGIQDIDIHTVTLADSGTSLTLAQDVRVFSASIGAGSTLNVAAGNTLNVVRTINIAGTMNLSGTTVLRAVPTFTGNGKVTGTGVLELRLSGLTYNITGDAPFGDFGNGTVDIVSGFVNVGAEASSSGGADASLTAKRIIVREGATFQTHKGGGSKAINTTKGQGASDRGIYTESGATLANKDGNINWRSNIYLNIASGTSVADITANNITYNADGRTYFNMYWAKWVVWDGVVRGDGLLSMSTGTNDGQSPTYFPHRLILNNNGNTFSGTYLLGGVHIQELALNQTNAAKDAKVSMVGEGILGLVIRPESATIAGLMEGGTKSSVYGEGTGKHTLTINTVNAGDDFSFAGVIKNYDNANHRKDDGTMTADATLALVKDGAGRQELTGANTATESLTVKNGTLALGGVSGKWAGNVSVEAAGTFELSHTVAYTTTNTITMEEGATLKVSGVDETFNGSLTATGIKLVVEAGAQLTINDTATTAHEISLASSGSQLNGTLVIKDMHTTLSGTLTPGENGLLVAGWTGRRSDNSNVVDVSGLTYGGDLQVNNGTSLLVSGFNNTFGDITVVSGGQFGITQNTTLKSGATLTISGDGAKGDTANNDWRGALKLADGTKLTGNVAISGGGASVSLWGSQSGVIDGTVTGSGSDTLKLLNGNGSSSTLLNTLTIKQAVTGVNAMEVEAGTLVVEGAVGGFTGAFSKDGAGKLVLTGGISGTGIDITAGDMDISGTIALVNGITNSGSGTVNILSGSTIDLTNWAFTEGSEYKVYTIGSGINLAETGITWSKDGTFNAEDCTYSVLSSNVFTGTTGHNTFMWGGTENNLYDDNTVSSATNDKVVFKGTSNVTLAAETVTTPRMLVFEGATVNLDGDGHTLTADALQVDGTLALVSSNITFGSGTTLATGENGTLKLAWTGRNASVNDSLESLMAAPGVNTVVASGTSFQTGTTDRSFDVTVENGGQLVVNNVITGNVTISGAGLSDNTVANGASALRIATGKKIVGDIIIDGASATLSASGGTGHLNGKVIGADAENGVYSQLNFVDGGTQYTCGMVGINAVDVASGTLHVGAAYSGDKYWGATDFGGTFTKSGAGTLNVNASSAGTDTTMSGVSQISVTDGIMKLQGTITDSGTGSISYSSTTDSQGYHGDGFKGLVLEKVTYAGNFVVTDGTVGIGNGIESGQSATLSINKLTVNDGATARIRSAGTTATGTDIELLDGGRLYLHDSYQATTTHDFKNLVLNSTALDDATKKATLEFGWKGVLNFAQLTGTGKLDVTQASGWAQDQKLSFGSIVNFTGTVTDAVTSSNHIFQIGTVHQETVDDIATFNVYNGVVSTGFHKTGAGAVTINKLVASGDLHMTYGGTLTLSDVSVANNTTLHYHSGESGLINLGSSNLTGVSALTVNVDDAGISTSGASSYDLGVTSGFDKSGISIHGWEGSNVVTLSASDGTWHLTANLWDSNWGEATVSAGPGLGNVATVSGTSGDIFMNSVDAYHYTAGGKEVAAIRLTDAGSNEGRIVYGGVPKAGNSNTTVTSDSWLLLESGSYKALVGGNFSTWANGASYATAFIGDSHIAVHGGSVKNIIGGNSQDNQGGNAHSDFTGNSYISIYDGTAVTGSIIGASTMVHGGDAAFIGDSNIYIYDVLKGDGEDIEIPGSPLNLVIGGRAHLKQSSHNLSSDINNYTTGACMKGDTNITISTGDATGDFTKGIIGGNYHAAGDTGMHANWSTGSHIKLIGDTNVSIAADNEVVFKQNVVGGSVLDDVDNHLTRELNEDIITGTTNINISGGTFEQKVVGGSIVARNGMLKIGGTDMSLSGGVFSGEVYGGSYFTAGTADANSGNVELAAGDISITVGGTADLSATNLYGGSFEGAFRDSNDSGHNLVHGDITITVEGGRLGNIYGGSHIDATAAKVTQGAIVVDLQGGSIGGDVYAAGLQDGGGDTITTASTTVKLQSGVTFGEGDHVVSGGFGRTTEGTPGSGVTGTRTLNFTSEGGEYSTANVQYKDFDVVDAHDDTVTFKSIATGKMTLDGSNGGSIKNLVIGNKEGDATKGAITGAKDETDANNIKALGEMTGLKLTAAAEMDISDVTMKDVTITTSNTVRYLDRVTAIANSANVATTGASSGLVSSGDVEGGQASTLTKIDIEAKPVQDGGTATGTLTVDVAYSLLDANRGNTLTWEILKDVDYSGLTLRFGEVLTTLVDNGLPPVGLEVKDGSGNVLASRTIGAADIVTPGYNLLPLDGITSGTVVLTIENIPEPATGVLSVLALAGLAARRRRKSDK